MEICRKPVLALCLTQLFLHLDNCLFWDRDEELLGQGLALNDSLQTLLAKHDAIASGSPLPTEAISSSATSAPGTSSPPSKVIDSSSKVTAPETQVAVTTHQVDEEDEEDDDFAQLARRSQTHYLLPISGILF